MSDVPECRIVLVRPHYPGNIGATARVMANFGLRDLVLVAPLADPLGEEAIRLATHGEPVLRAARMVAELSEAVADCVRVAATSGRDIGIFRSGSAGTPEAILPQYTELAGPVALVFGPEPSGLTDAEVSRCHNLICIPTDERCPSLNLSHAVGVCAYEWYGLIRKRTRPVRPRTAATFASQERMFEHLRRGLEAIHFIYGTQGDTLWAGVRHLLGRAGPTEIEVRWLHGLARQLLWIAAQRSQTQDALSRREDNS